MMTLYHGEPNLFALKPLIALEEAGLAYDSRPISQVPLERAVPGYPAETAHRVNVERDGPVLVDGGVLVTGSFFLLEYLAETHPTKDLLPDTPLARYRAQAIAQVVANLVAPFVVKLGLAARPVPADPHGYADIQPSERREAWIAAAQGGKADDAADCLRPTIARLENQLNEGGEWFLGSYSIVDIDVFAIIRNLPDLAPDLLGNAPGLQDFLSRMAARPAVAAALARATVSDAGLRYTPGPEISRWG